MKFISRFFQDAPAKKATAWAFFDFANSSYALLIGSFVFPIYYKEVVAGSARGDLYWGILISTSILIGGLLAPAVGAMADQDNRKQQKFIFFTLMAVAGSALLYLAGPTTFVLTSIIFLISNVCFEIAQTVYDSFLDRVSTPRTVGRISGLAWGLGYVGGVVAMVLMRPLFADGYAGALDAQYRLTFPLTALFFLIFALPAFFALKEYTPVTKLARLFERFVSGAKRMFATIRSIREHKNIAIFLLAFYFMNDALVTIFSFIPIYARSTFGMTFEEIFGMLLIVQLLGFPCATFFGWLADRKGSKFILLCTIMVWALIVILLAAATSKEVFYFIAFLTAFVIGSSQAIARSWLSRLVPEEKRFEFFGFNGFASKIAATTGPVLFGVISTLTGNQRYAVLALLPFFIIAFWLFTNVKDAVPENA